jgi:uncharacterized coiled-coil protein SlyX
VRNNLFLRVFSGAVFISMTAAFLPGQSMQETPKPSVKPSVTEDIDARVVALEKQLAEQEKEFQALRDEIARLKNSKSSTTSSTAKAMANDVTVKDMSATDEGAADPPRSLVSSNSGASAVTPIQPATTARSVLDSTLRSTHFFSLMDVYYSYNVHQPVSGLSNLRLFDSETNQFALNMLELGAIKAPDSSSRFGYNFTLGFGDAVNLVNQHDPGGLGYAQYLVEAYASYRAPVGSGLQVDVGKFASGAGAEVMESDANWNYSRGLLYDYGLPFYLFGIRARTAFGPKYLLTGYLVNGWDNVVDTYSSGKTIGFSFRWMPTRKFSVTETVLAGRGATPQDEQWRKVSSTVVEYLPNEKLSLMANALYGRNDQYSGFANPVQWSGVAGYVRYRMRPYSIASRYEYYDDPDGVTTCGTCLVPTPQHVQEVTGTLERSFQQHLISRFEIRRDRSNKPAFYRGNTAIPTQTTVTASLMFAFGRENSATPPASQAEK